MIRLLSAASTGNGSAVPINQGGQYIWRVGGTFGGTTVKLQELGVDGVTWEDITSASMTAAGKLTLSITASTTIRAVATGGSGVSVTSDLGALQ